MGIMISKTTCLYKMHGICNEITGNKAKFGVPNFLLRKKVCTRSRTENFIVRI